MSTQDHTEREKAQSKAPSRILALQHELQGRLVSAGGRPADPSPTIRRLVPIKKQVWRELQKHASLLSRLGQPVSPGQLAAMLLENSVNRLRLQTDPIR